ncbi:succinate dehydrogenase [Pelagibius sp. Alg239-R121]|uniref:succinate dehydrogenase n=1 Tax=Pelagibius sp. Alg239-R121 TaxID=2993448 RepID=UPI0024A69D47|nr:succinate dehydrogenase [Pelagibius sp. Alg239-R121]
MLDLRLYMAQRISALIMIPLTLGHIAMMIYAVQGGLSAGEILARTQGSLAWMLFYGSFVAAVSVHAAIGLRVILFESFKIKETILNALSWTVFLGLLYMGARAVYAVTAL